jgi:hypothetical protein
MYHLVFDDFAKNEIHPNTNSASVGPIREGVKKFCLIISSLNLCHANGSWAKENVFEKVSVKSSQK